MRDYLDQDGMWVHQWGKKNPPTVGDIVLWAGDFELSESEEITLSIRVFVVFSFHCGCTVTSCFKSLQSSLPFSDGLGWFE